MHQIPRIFAIDLSSGQHRIFEGPQSKQMVLVFGVRNIINAVTVNLFKTANIRDMFGYVARNVLHLTMFRPPGIIAETGMLIVLAANTKQHSKQMIAFGA